MKVLSVGVAPYEGGRYFIINVDDENIGSFALRYDNEVLQLLSMIDNNKVAVLKVVVSTLPEKLVAPIILQILVGSIIEIKQESKTNSYGTYTITKILSVNDVQEDNINNVVLGVKTLLDPMAALNAL